MTILPGLSICVRFTRLWFCMTDISLNAIERVRLPGKDFVSPKMIVEYWGFLGQDISLKAALTRSEKVEYTPPLTTFQGFAMPAYKVFSVGLKVFSSVIGGFLIGFAALIVLLWIFASEFY